jgi:alpha-glucosidase
MHITVRPVRKAALPIVLLAICCFADTYAAHAGQSAVPHAKSAASSAAAERDWWKNAVIYQVYPRSFQDSNGDGIGDLNGITEHLDYLQSLGVDAIWLTPIQPSPNADYGYDVADYRDVSPEYGSLDDFNRLIAEAKKRKIRVILDMVMNHTSDENAWFVQSRSSRTDPYRNWYVWRDGKGETATSQGAPPNNWGGFGRSSWEWDPKTRQYYYHHFSVHQPDLNWYNPAIEQEFKEIASYWLQLGVAGFRFDAIETLFEDPNFEDEQPALDKNGKPVLDRLGHPMMQRTKEGDLPQVHTVMRQMRAQMDTFNANAFPGRRVLVGEIFSPSASALLKWYGTRQEPEFELPMEMRVAFVNKLDVPEFRERLVEAETKLDGNVPLLVFDNHDQPRMDVRYGDGVHNVAIQRVLSTILFTSGGASLMYYGDEIGMKTTPPARKEDVKDKMAGLAAWPRFKGRDGERTPMQWNDTANAGFTTGTPWLPVPPTASTVNVKAEEGQPDSLLMWYRALIRLKKTTPALETGSNTMVDTANTKVLSWIRRAPGHPAVLVSLNFTAEPQTTDLSNATGGAKGKLRTLLKSPGGVDPRGTDHIELSPFGVYIGQLQ